MDLVFANLLAFLTDFALMAAAGASTVSGY